MMTIPEMREKILARLLDRKGQAYSNGICYYRTLVTPPGQTECTVALGCLIPDEHYDRAAEGASLRDLDIVDGKWFWESKNRRSISGNAKSG